MHESHVIYSQQGQKVIPEGPAGGTNKMFSIMYALSFLSNVHIYAFKSTL